MPVRTVQNGDASPTKVDLTLQNDYLLWIATAFYAAHIMEEFAFDWRSWASKRINLPVNWQWFHIVNAAVVLLGICCASVGWRLPEFSLIYPALMTINAVFFHILPSVILRRISPGIVTALVLFLPIATAIYAAAVQDGVLTPRALTVSTLGGILTMAYPIVLLKAAAKDSPIFKL